MCPTSSHRQVVVRFKECDEFFEHLSGTVPPSGQSNFFATLGAERHDGQHRGGVDGPAGALADCDGYAGG